MEDQTALPTHIGFILDGNRRWAREHTLPEMDGHLAGYNATKEVVDACFEQGIRYVTIYAFSAENWRRSANEVTGLMKLALQVITKDLKWFIGRGIKIKFVGRKDGLGPKLLAAIERGEEATKLLRKGTLAICFNYSGQYEIVDAARKCIQEGMAADEVTEETLAQHLYAPEVPPIDLVVRTSGEHRLSNFMLWRVAYSEFLFLEKYWPDMTKEDVTAIIEEYGRRSRRFGG